MTGNRILDDLRESFRKGSALTKLIYINLGVYVIILFGYMLFFLFTSSQYSIADKKIIYELNFLKYLETPTNITELALRPWTLITYMFAHFRFGHILFNMIALYFFGQFFLKYFNGKQLITTYLLGGLFGVGLYILAYNVFPGLGDGQILGASAAVMAILAGTTFYHPEFKVYYPFIGEVKLIYIGLFFIFIDLLSIGLDNNAGGHISHLGGALYGYLFAVQLKKGKDMGKGFSSFIDSIASMFKRRSKLKVAYKTQARKMTDEDYNQSKAATQKEVDHILDKIAKSGYDSLSKKEKEILFKMSK